MPVLGLGAFVLVLLLRRAERARMARALDHWTQARATGSHRARLQHPQIDLARCMGCGACVRACPEEDVLGLIHGQAALVHAAHCVGHGLCAEVCPVDAIAVTLADLHERRDIPVVDARLQVPGQPGLFLAGEINGRALIRTAVAQGKAVASEIAFEKGLSQRSGHQQPESTLDLLVVGAGPAGLACALQAQLRGLRVELLDQEPLGGTVSKYPRAKMVLTQPVELPLVGWLNEPAYTKETLLGIWRRALHDHGLVLHEGVRFLGAERHGTGRSMRWSVRTTGGTLEARNVCMAIGRRGNPRKLEVPGAELEKVHYALLDPRDHRGLRVLVVGGGDSAVEAALVLAMQPATQVTLSYRQERFLRLHARNRAALAQAEAQASIQVLRQSQVQWIEPGKVHLTVGHNGEATQLVLENDAVFALLGGEAPYPQLKALGVSFDPSARLPEESPQSASRSLLNGLLVAFGVALAAAAWGYSWRDYYGLPLGERPLHSAHAPLRPSGVLGIVLGMVASVLVCTNLLYLLRKAGWRGVRFGSLRAWMSLHVTSGICALWFAIVHAAFRLGDTTGSHALLALGVVVLTGSVGRYVYSFVPRAANGRELELEEVRSEWLLATSAWDDSQGAFAGEVRAELDFLVEGAHWRGPFAKRVWELLRSRAHQRASLARLRAKALGAGLSSDQFAAWAQLVRRGHKAALWASHFEDLRLLLASWRHLHRWIALLLVLLLGAHIVDALRFGRFFD